MVKMDCRSWIIHHKAEWEGDRKKSRELSSEEAELSWTTKHGRKYEVELRPLQEGRFRV